MSELPFTISKSLTGRQIKYACPQCRAELYSPLADAGNGDTCPTCSATFMVPGRAIRDAEQQRRQQEVSDAEQLREAAAQAKRQRAITEQQREEERARIASVKQVGAPEYRWLLQAGRVIMAVGVLLALLGFGGILLAIYMAYRADTGLSPLLLFGGSLGLIWSGVLNAAFGQAALAFRDLVRNSWR